MRIGQSAYRYGLPGYEIDDLLMGIANALGLSARVIATPSMLDCTIDGPGGQRRLFIRLGEVSYNLHKLSQTLTLTDSVLAGKVGVDEADRRLDEIESFRPPYPAPVVGAAYGACGAGFAVLLSAGWRDVALAAGLSIVVFMVMQASGRWPWLEHRIYVVSALVAGTLAGIMGAILGESNTSVVALSAFVVLIPGLGLTLGAFELASGHTVLGWHRFIRAAVRTFALFAGAAIGGTVTSAMFGATEAPDGVVSTGLVQWTFLVVLMAGLVIVFQVVPRQAPWSVLAGMLAYSGLELGGRAGIWQGPFLGALAIGLFAAVYVRLRRRSNPLIVVLPGVLILVPGVAAYATLRTLDPDSGTAFVSSSSGVLIQIVAILAGLFTAGSLVDFRRPVRHVTPSSTTPQENSHD